MQRNLKNGLRPYWRYPGTIDYEFGELSPVSGLVQGDSPQMVKIDVDGEEFAI